MNSLAEKGVFRFARFAKMARVEGRTDERGPHGETSPFFQIARPKFDVVGFVPPVSGASVFAGTGWSPTDFERAANSEWRPGPTLSGASASRRMPYHALTRCIAGLQV